MKGWKKSLLALMGAVCLTFAAKTTVRAAETPAPFTAEQLMAAVFRDDAVQLRFGPVRRLGGFL